MKFIISFSFLILFAASGINAQAYMPSVDAKTLDGQSVDLKTFGDNGKITFVSFWATWCTPCKKELDALAEFYPDWQEEYDMEIVAITIDNSRQLAKVPAIVETKGWDYTILAADQTTMQTTFNFQTIPHSFLIDREGKIMYTHSGYVPGDEYELEDHIKELAGAK